VGVCSVFEGHEQRSSTLDPVLGARVGCVHGSLDLEINVHHERITVHATLADRVVVRGAAVYVGNCLALRLLDRLEMDDRHLDFQLHDCRLAQVLPVFVPIRAFKVEASDVSAIFRWGLTQIFN